MNIAGAVVIFIIWWWVVFIAVLPRGATARHEAPDDGVKGADPGAPTNPRIKDKMILTTKITAVLWALTAVGITIGARFYYAS